MNQPVSPAHPLFNDIRNLIDSARQRAAVAINAELTLLYWQVGQRINTEFLPDSEIVQTLSAQFDGG